MQAPLFFLFFFVVFLSANVVTGPALAKRSSLDMLRCHVLMNGEAPMMPFANFVLLNLFTLTLWSWGGGGGEIVVVHCCTHLYVTLFFLSW